MSIEAKELRRGNILNLHGREGNELVVWEIGTKSIGYGMLGNTDMGETQKPLVALYCYLKGVPLTEDILLKCPQFENDYQFSFKFKSIRIEYLFEKWNCRFIISETESLFVKEIEFLHDLQNVTYALTKEELEINL